MACVTLCGCGRFRRPAPRSLEPRFPNFDLPKDAKTVAINARDGDDAVFNPFSKNAMLNMTKKQP